MHQNKYFFEEKLEKIKKYSNKMIDKTMKDHTDYKLYNLIKQQVPKKSTRNVSFNHHLLNVTLPPDQNSTVSFPEANIEKQKKINRNSSVSKANERENYSNGRRWRNKIDLAVRHNAKEKRYDIDLKETINDI